MTLRTLHSSSQPPLRCTSSGPLFTVLVFVLFLVGVENVGVYPYHNPLPITLPDVQERGGKGVREVFGATLPAACQLLPDPSPSFAGAEPDSLPPHPPLLSQRSATSSHPAPAAITNGVPAGNIFLVSSSH